MALVRTRRARVWSAAVVARNTFLMRVGLARLAALPSATQLELATGTVAPGTPVDPIVHELLHHAAANSTVNIIMQYRWLRLLRALLSSPYFSVAGDDQLMAIATNMAAIEAVLQPLAEGIALYGEHDCAMPDVEQFKRTGYGITDGIAVRLLALQHGMGTHVADFAAASRREKLSPAAVARRADVLCHPLFPRTGNDAYLLGYLMVKAIADRAVRAGGVTPAMLVEFLLYYVYEDWTLAHLLAAPGPVDIDAIVGRLRSRLRALVEGDPAARVAAFIADKREREARGMLPRGAEELEHGPFAGIGVTADEFGMAAAAMLHFWREWVGPAAPVSDDRLDIVNLTNPVHELLMSPLPASGAAFYLERHAGVSPDHLRVLDFALDIPDRKRALGTALDVAVEFAPDSAGALHLRPEGAGAWQVSIPGLAGDRGSGRGRLLGVFMSTGFPWRLYCYLFSDDELLASWTHGDSDDGESQEIASVLIAEREVEELNQASLAEMAGVVEHSARDFMSAEGTDSTDAASVAMCDALREVLCDCGWAPLFADPAGGEYGVSSLLEQGDLVTPLAALGLCNAFCRTRSEVEGHLADVGHDLNALIAGCEQLEASTGLRLLATDDHEIRARI